MEKRSLRAWLASRQAAERREREEERRSPVTPERAVSAALALIALQGRLNGWPVAEDAFARRGAEQARSQWERLRLRLRSG